MEYGAIYLHKRRSQVRIVREDGSVVIDREIDTSRNDLDRVFGGRSCMRILIESSTESEWVAQHLEALGHEVIVADPNDAPMYGSRSRKVKTDKRDVAALAEACRTGIYRRAHRASAGARSLRRTVLVRSHLMRQRSQTIRLLRSLLRQEGLRVASGSAEHILTRFDQIVLPAALPASVSPLRAVIRGKHNALTFPCALRPAATCRREMRFPRRRAWFTEQAGVAVSRIEDALRAKRSLSRVVEFRFAERRPEGWPTIGLKPDTTIGRVRCDILRAI